MSMKNIEKIVFDFPAILEKLTNKKGWEELEGLDSGTGIDYNYVSENNIEAYINIDQDFISICCWSIGNEDNYEIVFEGTIEELMEVTK